MFDEYVKLNNKIIATEDNKITIFNNSKETEEYIEINNNISLIKEELKESKNDLKNLPQEKYTTKGIVSTIPGALIMLHGVVLFLYYRYNVELKYSVNILYNWLIGSSLFLVTSNILVNKIYKKKNKNLVEKIDNLETLKLRYLNKKEELEKEIKIEKLEEKTEVKITNKKEMLENLKEELLKLKEIKEKEEANVKKKII